MSGWRKRTIMEMAREAQLPYFYQTGETANLPQLEAFAKLVREDEREACAKVAENTKAPFTAVAIRAREQA